MDGLACRSVVDVNVPEEILERQGGRDFFLRGVRYALSSHYCVGKGLLRDAEQRMDLTSAQFSATRDTHDEHLVLGTAGCHAHFNDTIADAIVFGPEPLGTICIDSKFPLENYRKLVEKGLSTSEREARSKAFESDVKKHIDAIATKYIIADETTDQAIMFLPAEAIFAEINAYHTNLIKYAASKRVWLTSPTTLMSLLTIIQSVLTGLERDKYTSVIHEELNKLGIEFSRYRDRWDKLSRSIQTVSNDVENIHKTTEKITKRFDSISNVKIENEETLLIEEDN